MPATTPSLLLVLALGACAAARTDSPGGPHDSGTGEESRMDASGQRADSGTASIDAAPGKDAEVSTPDAALPDAGQPDAAPPPPILTGGPCLSGAPGSTAYRVRWLDAGGTAQVSYEVNGLPDKSRDHTGAYGYQIGFKPSFVDPFLGAGGLQLNSSSFVDIELSTKGLTSIQSATLSILGRSYNTTTSGSFHWQTFDGVGAAPSGLVHNSAPYEWYSADMSSELSPGDDGVLLRIKAGPPSGSLVVHRIELCMEAS